MSNWLHVENGRVLSQAQYCQWVLEAAGFTGDVVQTTTPLPPAPVFVGPFQRRDDTVVQPAREFDWQAVPQLRPLPEQTRSQPDVEYTHDRLDAEMALTFMYPRDRQFVCEWLMGETFKDIGTRHGISASRVSQCVARGLRFAAQGFGLNGVAVPPWKMPNSHQMVT